MSRSWRAKRVNPFLLIIPALVLIEITFLAAEYYKQQTFAVYDNIDRTSKSVILHDSSKGGTVAGAQTVPKPDDAPDSTADSGSRTNPKAKTKAPPSNGRAGTPQQQAAGTSPSQTPQASPPVAGSTPSKQNPGQSKPKPDRGTPLCALGVCIPM